MQPGRTFVPIVSLIGALVLGTTVTVLRRNGHHKRYVTTTGA